jgi:hypothetical protein
MQARQISEATNRMVSARLDEPTPGGAITSAEWLALPRVSERPELVLHHYQRTRFDLARARIFSLQTSCVGVTGSGPIVQQTAEPVQTLRKHISGGVAVWTTIWHLKPPAELGLLADGSVYPTLLYPPLARLLLDPSHMIH